MAIFSRKQCSSENPHYAYIFCRFPKEMFFPLGASLRSAWESVRFASERSRVQVPPGPPDGHYTNTYFFKGGFAVRVWLWCQNRPEGQGTSCLGPLVFVCLYPIGIQYPIIVSRNTLVECHTKLRFIIIFKQRLLASLFCHFFPRPFHGVMFTVKQQL